MFFRNKITFQNIFLFWGSVYGACFLVAIIFYCITYPRVSMTFDNKKDMAMFILLGELQKDYVRSIPLIEDSANTETEYKNLLEHANSVINRLPERQRTVYHLSIREGLSIEEISVKLGISKRTIENHLYRAKTLLKKALSDNRLSSILFICLFIQ